MMMLSRVLLCSLLGMLLADDPKAATEADRAKLRGTWDMIASSFDGKSTPDELIKQRQMLITGDQLIAIVSGEKKRALTIKIDSAHTPRQIDLKMGTSDEMARGIFELNGDELKICYGEPGAERAKEFLSKAGSKQFLLVLKRSKKDD